MTASIDLNLIRAFVGVHETGSFSATALRLGVPRSTVSRAIAALEDSSGVRLFHRTTRKVATTAAGAAFFERVAPHLQAMEASIVELPDALGRPTGTLRIAATPDLGSTVVARAVAIFAARHPEVQVDVRLSATEVDLVRDRFDLALRFVMGRMPPSSLVARRVGTAVIQFYASPTYVSRRGAPRELADLHDHDWVSFAHARELAPGPVPDRASRPPRARTVCDDKFFARELLRSGAGIGLLPLYLAAPDLRAGTLVRVLPRWERRRAAIYLVQPSRTKVPARVTAFRDVLIEHLRQEPLGQPAPPS